MPFRACAKKMSQHSKWFPIVEVIIIIIRNEEIYVAFSHKNCKDT